MTAGHTPKYAELAARLRQNPGAWEVVAEVGGVKAASSLSQAVGRGYLVAFRPGRSYQAVIRDRRVLARFVGPAGPHDADKPPRARRTPIPTTPTPEETQ